MRHILQAKRRFGNIEGLRLWAARVGWLIITLYAILLVALSLPHYWALRIPQDLAEATITSAMFRQDFSQAAFEVPPGVKLLTLIPFFIAVGCGVFIFYQRSQEWIAGVVSLLLITMGATFTISLSHLPVTYAVWQAPAGILEAVMYGCSFLFLTAFPNGRFVPKWFRWVALGWVAYAALWPFWPQLNPLQSASITPIIILIGMFLLGISAQIYRVFHRANATQRQQLKWVLWGYTTAVWGMLWVFGPQLILGQNARHYLLSPPMVWINLAIALIFPLLIPITLMLSILRYRLWDVDILLNRTLVYGGLTLAVVLIYVLTVGLLSQLFHTSGNLMISLIATALIAVAFHPVRERLQRGVNRLMFGQRDDPYAVLSHLGQQLQTTAVPAETLAAIVETLAGTLKLPYAAIELVEQAEQVGRASVGEPLGEPVELPLRYQKETVGHLIVSPRAPRRKIYGQRAATAGRYCRSNRPGRLGYAADAGPATLP